MEFNYGWMADPVYFGDYPASMRKSMGDKLPTFTPEESALLKGSMDYFACKWVYVAEPITRGAVLPWQ